MSLYCSECLDLIKDGEEVFMFEGKRCCYTCAEEDGTMDCIGTWDAEWGKVKS